MLFVVVAFLAMLGVYAIWCRLNHNFNRMFAFDQELASAKAESAALRRQITADLAKAHQQAKPMLFLENLNVSELQREIEFHRARKDDSIDARLNILLLDGSFPIIRDYTRYTAE